MDGKMVCAVGVEQQFAFILLLFFINLRDYSRLEDLGHQF